MALKKALVALCLGAPDGARALGRPVRGGGALGRAAQELLGGGDDAAGGAAHRFGVAFVREPRQRVQRAYSLRGS